jgi:hypothetical protein
MTILQLMASLTPKLSHSSRPWATSKICQVLFETSSLSITPKPSGDTESLGRGMEIVRVILYRRIACNFHTLRVEEDKVKNMSKDAKTGFYVLGGAFLATIACMVLGFMVG